jgi:receptor protein-tyrosine kinase
VLGTIPQSRAIQRSGPGGELPPTGMEGEAFRMLRANLRYFNVDREITSILITSAAPQDGKTTVAWNVAMAEARAGKRVLYIEADLRRPTLSGHLGISPDIGLSLVLSGAETAPTAIQNVQGVDLIFAGPLPPNPAELIESQRMTELLTWGEEKYDRVIVDTPPAAVVADAVSLFNQVDGVVIVARLNKSPREAAEHLRDQLANTSAPMLGIVINGVASPADSGYYRSQPTATPFPADSSGDAETGQDKSEPAEKDVPVSKSPPSR